jgi:hypothetical protein
MLRRVDIQRFIHPNTYCIRWGAKISPAPTATPIRPNRKKNLMKNGTRNWSNSRSLMNFVAPDNQLFQHAPESRGWQA